MLKKTLLLDSTYEYLSFISERKVFKLLFKEKVETISTWDEEIQWKGNSKIKYPAILRLKNYSNIKRIYKSTFSRQAVIKRDKYICQYCGVKLLLSQITMDHVIPKSHGGVTSFMNCVVSCTECNGKKANRTPEQAGMTLLRKPFSPSFKRCDDIQNWHNDWNTFLANVI